jgi:DNA-binding response OmpR family regulator
MSNSPSSIWPESAMDSAIRSETQVILIGDRRLEVHIADVLQRLDCGYQVVDPRVCTDALSRLTQPSLVLLLCDGAPDGLEKVRRVRRASPGSTLCVLSAEACSEAATDLLGAGADIWLPLAMDKKLILAFVQAAVRRVSRDLTTRSLTPPTPSVAGTVHVCGHPVRLRAAESRILQYLMGNQGRWVGEAELRQRVLHVGAHSSDSLVRVHVSNIRKALGENQACILSRRRLGYRFQPSIVGAGAAGISGETEMYTSLRLLGTA